MWSATQIPHILRFALAATTGVPESKIRVIAPDVGGGFGGKLQTTPEEWIVWCVARRLGKPVKYTETRSESLMAGHHGRDQWQKLTVAATKDGTVTGLKVDLLADLGAYVALVGGGVPVLGAFMFNSIYKFPAYQFSCQTVLTNKTWTDAYRGAGRPEATFAIERIMDELAARARHRPARAAGEELDQARGVPVHHRGGARVRLRQLRGRHRQGQGDVRVRRAAGRAASSGVTRTTRSSSASASRRSPRCAAWRPPGCSAASTTAPAAGSTRRVRMLATGKVEVVTGSSRARPGPRDRLVADRGRPARRALRGRRGAARRHPGLAPRHGHLRLPIAGRRWRGAGQGRRQGDREGQADRGAHARGVGRRHRVQRRPVRGQGHRQGRRHRGDRDGDLHRRTTCPTASSRRWTPMRRTTR